VVGPREGGGEEGSRGEGVEGKGEGRGKGGGKGTVKEKGDKGEGKGKEGEKGMRRGREGSGAPIAPLAQGPALAKAGFGTHVTHAFFPRDKPIR